MTETVSGRRRCVLVGDGITFTSIHMPLVRTPMIAPTRPYDRFPHEINTLLGNVGAVAHTPAPKLAFRLLNLAHHVFPDSAVGRNPGSPGTRESEQVMLAKVFKGVHW